MIHFNKKMRSLSTMVAIASTLAIASASASALASSPTTATCQLVKVSAGTLVIQIPGNVSYYAQLNAVGCTTNNQSADTLKAWTSLAQAALVSGKSLQIYFNVCGGINYISALDLKP